MAAERPALEKLPAKANLRPKEIAAFLDVGLSTVYELIASGAIPAHKPGGQYRIPRDKFLEALDGPLRFQPELF